MTDASLSSYDVERRFVDEAAAARVLKRRNRWAGIWGRIFLAADLIAIVALVLVFGTIINQVFGLVVVKYAVDPASLSSKPLAELSESELGAILLEKVPRARLRVLVRDNLLGKTIDPARFGTETMGQLAAGKTVDPEIAPKKFSDLSEAELVKLLSDNLDTGQLYSAIQRDVVKPDYILSWRFLESIFNRAAIEQEAQRKAPDGTLEWHSWIDWQFVVRELTSDPSTTGLRMALTGSLLIILLTILIALPLGVGAAIYLEEYATKSRLNALIETNIRNLAGVPSIIYGMLGLAVFVRLLGDTAGITSGRAFGVTDSNGRTILSASLTMALLILPVVIINAQEAIRAVAPSIREASYGVGATKWQTVWRQVLPAAVPGIMTGLILSISRAVGETAPLIVVGGLTFVTLDPNSIFSKFTVVPIQVYSWTAEPRPEFKNVAAAAIIVLLIVLLALNATAIIIRGRVSKRLRG